MSALVNGEANMGASSTGMRKRPLPPPMYEDDVPLNDKYGDNRWNVHKDNLRDGYIARARSNVEMQSNEPEGNQVEPPVPRPKTGAKVAQTRVTVGMRLKKWVVTGRIGAGSFGETFTAVEVPEDDDTAPEDAPRIDSVPPDSNKPEVCIKVEQEDKNLLRLEAAALKKMQPCPYVVRYVGSGSTGGINFLVMQKLGRNLAELRRGTPHGTFSPYTTLKAGISCLEAIRGVHNLGFVHRDIKPSNFVIGTGVSSDIQTCYLIDFGLARRYRKATNEIRPPRANAGFRGTSRYASLASHHHEELGRVDDLWSLLFMLIEFATGTLPWRKYKEKEDIGRCKEEVIGPGLVQNLPREFRQFLSHLATLRYEDEPNYDFLISLMARAIERRGYPPFKRLDWEPDENSQESSESLNEKYANAHHSSNPAYNENKTMQSVPQKPSSALRPSAHTPDAHPRRPAPVFDDALANAMPTPPPTPVPPPPSHPTVEEEEEEGEEEGVSAAIRVSDVEISYGHVPPPDAGEAEPRSPTRTTGPHLSSARPKETTPSDNPRMVKWVGALNDGHSSLRRADSSIYEKTITVDVDEGYSPREDLENTREWHSALVGRGKPERNAKSPSPVQQLPHAAMNEEQQQEDASPPSPQRRKKSVSFALEERETGNDVGSPPKRTREKKKKNKTPCKCEAM